MKEQHKWTADVPKTGICPAELLNSPDLSGNESQRVTVSHPGFHGLDTLLKKKKKVVFNIKWYSNSLKCPFQCHCGAYINSNILRRKLITLKRAGQPL